MRARRPQTALPLHSFRTLLKDLATLTYNIARTPANPNVTLTVIARPTPVPGQGLRTARPEPQLFPVTIAPETRNRCGIKHLRLGGTQSSD